MNLRWIILFVAMTYLVACQQPAAPPAPGQANLQIKVLAEPKSGANMANLHVSVFEEPARSPVYATTSMEKVDYADLSDIVVWLQPINVLLDNALPLPHPFIHLNVEERSPATGISAAAAPGDLITFTNTGTTRINLYSVSDNNEFDLGDVDAGASRSVTPKSPGVIEVWTDSVARPLAKIYVAPSRWTRLAHAGETITFHDLPPGHWKILSWHPRLPGHETNIDLLPNQSAAATIRVGVNGLPQIPSTQTSPY